MYSVSSKKVSSVFTNVADTLHAKVGAEGPTFAAAFTAIILFFLVVPIEMSQLSFALFGALTYAVLQSLQIRRPKSYDGKGGAKGMVHRKVDSSVPRCGQYRPVNGSGSVTTRPQMRTRASTAVSDNRTNTPAIVPGPRVEVRKPSSQPISAPVFQGEDWDAEVNELLGQIMPSAEGEHIVKAVADFVEQRIKPLIPEVEVLGFASGDLVRGTAFGVAVPEVDIVVNVSPHILVQRLQGRFSKGSFSTMRLDVRKLQKSAIRACTDRLVSAGGFKFRRSAFRGEEPKVTLLVPASFGVSDESIPIDFTVNSTTPLYNMALFTECGNKEARSKALILLVKRWAKDRGVCHAAKGHLSPYPWSLLTIFFMQAGRASESDGPLLPPVEDFEVSSSLLTATEKLKQERKIPTATKWTPPNTDGAEKTVGQLFKEFVHFYHCVFDWRKEAICVRTGRRGPPGLSLPIHIILNEDTQATEVGPNIEDPFNPSRNLGVVMNSTSLERLHKEIARANELCASGCSLTRLLEPWAPPERPNVDGEEDEEGEKEIIKGENFKATQQGGYVMDRMALGA